MFLFDVAPGRANLNGIFYFMLCSIKTTRICVVYYDRPKLVNEQSEDNKIRTHKCCLQQRSSIDMSIMVNILYT